MYIKSIYYHFYKKRNIQDRFISTAARSIIILSEREFLSFCKERVYRLLHMLRKRYGECTLFAVNRNGKLYRRKLEPLDARFTKQFIGLEVAVHVVCRNGGFCSGKLNANLVHAPRAER